MDTECIQMKIRIYTRDIGKMMNKMVQGRKCTRMGVVMKDNSKRDRRKERDY